MLTAWVITIIHALLCAAVVIGVLFSRTLIAKGAVLGILLLLFIGIRFFRGCALDQWEVYGDKPTLTEMGMATSVKDYKEASAYDFEQSVVGNLLVIHIIKIYALSIYPFDTLF